MVIEMGRIRSIERRSSRSARVTLESGRELIMDGTNDVDEDNRGVDGELPAGGSRRSHPPPGPCRPAAGDEPVAVILGGFDSRVAASGARGELTYTHGREGTSEFHNARRLGAWADPPSGDA